jgi:hypothetical protein
LQKLSLRFFKFTFLIYFKADVSKLYYGSVNHNKHMLRDRTHLVFKSQVAMNTDNARLAKLRAEIEKEKSDRAAWRKAFVPPYFESEWGRAYLEHNNKSGSARDANGNYMQTSEHDFGGAAPQVAESAAMNNGIRNGTTFILIVTILERASFNKNFFIITQDELARSDSKLSKKYSSLPPISFNEIESLQKKESNQQQAAVVERYQAQFKYADKLDDSKLPNSIKFNRPTVGPNKHVSVAKHK